MRLFASGRKSTEHWKQNKAIQHQSSVLLAASLELQSNFVRHAEHALFCEASNITVDIKSNPCGNFWLLPFLIVIVCCIEVPWHSTKPICLSSAMCVYNDPHLGPPSVGPGLTFKLLRLMIIDLILWVSLYPALLSRQSIFLCMCVWVYVHG